MPDVFAGSALPCPLGLRSSVCNLTTLLFAPFNCCDVLRYRSFCRSGVSRETQDLPGIRLIGNWRDAGHMIAPFLQLDLPWRPPAEHGSALRSGHCKIGNRAPTSAGKDWHRLRRFNWRFQLPALSLRGDALGRKPLPSMARHYSGFLAAEVAAFRDLQAISPQRRSQPTQASPNPSASTHW